MSVECIVCGHDVVVAAEAELGEIFDCDECGIELEVISRKPVGVSVFEEEEK